MCRDLLFMASSLAAVTSPGLMRCVGHLDANGHANLEVRKPTSASGLGGVDSPPLRWRWDGSRLGGRKWPGVRTPSTRCCVGGGIGPTPPHLHSDWAHPHRICSGTGLILRISAPGLGAPTHICAGSGLRSCAHLRRDWASHLRTSAPGLGFAPAHICARTGLRDTRPDGLGARALVSVYSISATDPSILDGGEQFPLILVPAHARSRLRPLRFPLASAARQFTGAGLDEVVGCRCCVL